jgi:hypothetical protein
MEQNICPICRVTFDTGAILLDRRLRDSMERHTTTSLSICPDCTTQSEDGWIALVGANGPVQDGLLKPQDAVYAAEYLWVKRYVADQLFNVPLDTHPFVYLEPAAIERVKEIIAAHTEKENENE